MSDWFSLFSGNIESELLECLWLVFLEDFVVESIEWTDDHIDERVDHCLHWLSGGS